MKKRFRLRTFAGLTTLAALAATVTMILAGGAGAVAGAAFTTIGPAPFNNCFSGPGLVNCNLYTDKTDVWINGGPVANDLTDGSYYFAVTNPSGTTLLSTDSYADRLLTVSGGNISATSTTTHTQSPAGAGVIVQLAPYADTPNNGGEYKAWVCAATDGLGNATVPADGTPPPTDAVCKTDNFKVRNPSTPCDPEVDPNCQPPTPFGVVNGQKYYDVNHNGQRDPGENGIANWPIDFTDGVTPNTQLTDTNGNFTLNLPVGSYHFAEELANSPWVQTGETNVGSQTEGQASDTGGNGTTLNTDKTYDVSVSDGGVTNDLLFGNVCTVTNTGGLTLGFWSNNNGKAILQAHQAAFATAINTTYWLVKANGTRFLVSGNFTTEYNAFRTWILAATSTNASYMLSAQLITTAFDRSFGTLSNYMVQDPVTFGGYTAGQWITIDTLVTVAGNATNGFTETYPNTTSSGTNRNNAVAYQTLFNSINNNQATVTPPGADGCPTPVFP